MRIKDLSEKTRNRAIDVVDGFCYGARTRPYENRKVSACLRQIEQLKRYWPKEAHVYEALSKEIKQELKNWENLNKPPARAYQRRIK